MTQVKVNQDKSKQSPIGYYERNVFTEQAQKFADKMHALEKEAERGVKRGKFKVTKTPVINGYRLHYQRI